MSEKKYNSKLAEKGARVILEAFTAYRRDFEAITRQAEIHFKDRDWHKMRAYAARRLGLYKTVVDRIEAEIRNLLAQQSQDKTIWSAIKAGYSGLISKRNDWELAETFFNSITRRLFATIGVDPAIEFVDTDFETPPLPAGNEIYRTYNGKVSIEEMIRTILGNFAPAEAFQDIQDDTRRVSESIGTQLRKRGLASHIQRADMVKNAFYRGTGAYIVNRLYVDSVFIPVAIALLNPPGVIRVDGVFFAGRRSDQHSVQLYPFLFSCRCATDL